MSRTSSPSTGRAYGLARVLAAEFVAGAPEIATQRDYGLLTLNHKTAMLGVCAVGRFSA